MRTHGKYTYAAYGELLTAVNILCLVILLRHEVS